MYHDKVVIYFYYYYIMKLSDSSMRRFLDIQSHERFANIYFKFSTTPLVVLSKKEIYMYNPEFKYYQHVDQTGRLMSLVSDVLHKALNDIHAHFKNKLLEVKRGVNGEHSGRFLAEPIRRKRKYRAK